MIRITVYHSLLSELTKSKQHDAKFFNYYPEFFLPIFLHLKFEFVRINTKLMQYSKHYLQNQFRYPKFFASDSKNITNLVWEISHETILTF